MDDLCVCGVSRSQHGAVGHSFNRVQGGSASSSPDDECETCGHYRANHDPGACLVCPSDMHHHPFAPAKPDAAQEAAMDELVHLRQEMEATEPEAPDCWACKHPAHRAFNCTEQRDGDDCGCGANAAEPEAPEEPGPTELAPCSICGERRKTNELKAGLVLCEPCMYGDGQPYCVGCGSNEPPFGLISYEGEDRFNELRCAKCLRPPRRPPYAVAYALASGETYEVALPGDATIRAVDGALVITHTSPVQGLMQTRPWEAS